jgi:hypothetical protein
MPVVVSACSTATRAGRPRPPGSCSRTTCSSSPARSWAARAPSSAYIMCKAMNRSIWNVVFGGFGAESGAAPASAEEPRVRSSRSTSTASICCCRTPSHRDRPRLRPRRRPRAERVCVRSSTRWRSAASVCASRSTRSPAACPGHMNVLLAEAGVSVRHRGGDGGDQRRPAEPRDVALIIGANDIVNPGAQTTLESDLRDAGAGGVEGEAPAWCSSADGGRLRRGREPAVLLREHADVVRRRPPPRSTTPAPPSPIPRTAGGPPGARPGARGSSAASTRPWRASSRWLAGPTPSSRRTRGATRAGSPRSCPPRTLPACSAGRVWAWTGAPKTVRESSRSRYRPLAA